MRIDNDCSLWTAKYGHIKQLNYKLTILPWGSTEPHNYHLPYLTDSIIAEEISRGCAKALLEKFNIRSMVFPAVNLGSQNLGQVERPFCVHASYQTQFCIMKDIVASLSRQGIDKLLIINGHGGNSFKNMIHDLAIDYPKVLVLASSWFKMVELSEIFDNPGNHADEVETSMIMYFRPDLVNLYEAGRGSAKNFAIPALAESRVWTPRNWSIVSEDTGIGNPSLSTAHKGQVCANKVIDSYVDFCYALVTKPLYAQNYVLNKKL